MTAIAGCWDLQAGGDQRTHLTRILTALDLYGAEARLVERAPVAFGFRPQPTLPEDRFDKQPLTDECSRYLCVADVRLDNRAELYAPLGHNESSGRELADSDIVFAAFLKWGERCVEHLLGAFAFAVWDSAERRLFCARDPLGERQFFYSAGSRCFAFASIARSLLVLPDVPRALEEWVLAGHLTGLPMQPGQSVYRAVRRLSPGHTLSVAADSSVRIVAYWSPLDVPEIRYRRDQDYPDRLHELLVEAVRCRTRSVAPIGSHLSSGFDSSSVTACAAEVLAAKGDRLYAFTGAPLPGTAFAAPGNRFADETAHAAATAALYPNVDHCIVRAEAVRPLDLIDRLNLLYDKPIVDPGNYVYITGILESARARGIGVMLTGVGGNGTISYRADTLLADDVRHGRLLRALRQGAALVGAGGRPRQVVSQAVRPLLPPFLSQLLNARRHAPPQSPLSPTLSNWPEWREIGAAVSAMERQRAPLGGAARRAMILQREFAPRAAAAHRAGWGIDERDPTVDRRIVAFCQGIPEDQYLRHGQHRWLIRRMMRSRLPDILLNEQRRGYQGADWHARIGPGERARLREEVECWSDSALLSRLLDLPRLRRLAAQWPQDGPALEHRVVLMRSIPVARFVRWFDGYAVGLPRSPD
jgi:asparagine synthase (glutamine-hydrolysing)